MSFRTSALFLLVATFAFAAGGTAASPRRPNILFAIADDWSHGHAGAYGSTWVKTPAFDQVAREGLLFSRAYTPNAKCAPSRASILTGRNTWQLKEAGNHAGFFPPEFKTYPEALGAAGYFVGFTNKGWAPGVALKADGSPRPLVGRAFDARKGTPPSPAMGKNDYAANFGDFLAAAAPDQPWCFWYGGAEPHRPYEYRSGATKGGKRTTDIDRVPAYWPDNDTVRHDLLDYAFEVEYFDRQLGRMIALLAERGELENTIIVVTSDNGMPFPRAKGQGYEFGLHLPLAIRWPAGIRDAGRIVDGFVSLIDLAPTFMEIAAVPWEKSGMAPAAGRSLTDVFASAGANAARDYLLFGQERHDVGRPADTGYPIRGIMKGNLAYLENFASDRWPACNPETGYLNTDGSPTKTEVLKARTDPAHRYLWELSFDKRGPEELYDLSADPDCMKNLAADPARTAVRVALHDQLYAGLRAQNDPRMRGEGAIFDSYPVARPDMRGFYEKYLRGDAPSADWVNPTDFEKWPLEKK